MGSASDRLAAAWGDLAFTEAVWRTTDAPLEVREAFADYPTMGRVEDVVPLIQESGCAGRPLRPAGRSPVGRLLLASGAADREAPGRSTPATPRFWRPLDEVAKEFAMHRRSGHHYGYNFFVARRV
jgi:hypothetical protein